MFFWRHKRQVAAATFFGRLARDVRGNTLAIMGAAMIPLAGMIGGGLDLSRMYIVKTRLQHACDAGALAGRKAMGAGTWSQSNNMPNTTAERFFRANYLEGAYGTSALSFNFAENAGKVSGAASAKIPLTLTKVLFGAVWAAANNLQTLSVTCATEMRLPNTDVMFVLDTTGSMASKAVSTDADTKIDSLKTAVKCFYEIVARLDTDANCVTGAPSGGTGSQVQVRFGFVPYSTNVNVGRLLKPEWIADSWPYQSRAARWWVMTKITGPSEQPASQPTSQSDCTYNNAVAAGYVYSRDSYSDNNTKKVTDEQDFKNKTVTWSGGYCSGIIVSSKKEYQLRENILNPTSNDQFIEWHYGKITQNISGLKNGSSFNGSFPLPMGASGASRSFTWDGCIEERQTVQAASYTPIPAGAKDLNIDLVPTSGDTTTLWAPALQQMIYPRAVTSAWTQATTAESYSTSDYYNGIPYYCPAAAKKLQQWPTASDFDTYVDSLFPTGNTYHDIGMLWGARLLSPTGLFASENAFTPQGGEIQRHMIFMTDGDAVSAACDYTAYGVAFWDQRTTTDVGTAAACTAERTQLDDQVNARLTALCTAVKNKNITLWVISFGSGSNATTEARLSACASDGKYFTARDSATLQSTFKSIADQISQLRLTQ